MPFLRPIARFAGACAAAFVCLSCGSEGTSPSSTVGIIDVVVAGLPSDVDAAIAITGPDGFSTTASKSRTLTDLRAGTYTVRATPSARRTELFLTTDTVKVVPLEGGRMSVVRVTYAHAGTIRAAPGAARPAGRVVLDGLPSSVSLDGKRVTLGSVPSIAVRDSVLDETSFLVPPTADPGIVELTVHDVVGSIDLRMDFEIQTPVYAGGSTTAAVAQVSQQSDAASSALDQIIATTGQPGSAQIQDLIQFARDMGSARRLAVQSASPEEIETLAAFYSANAPLIDTLLARVSALTTSLNQPARTRLASMRADGANPLLACEAVQTAMRDLAFYDDIATTLQLGIAALSVIPAARPVAAYISELSALVALMNSMVKSAPVLFRPQGLRVTIVPATVPDAGGVATMSAVVDRRAALSIGGEPVAILASAFVERMKALKVRLDGIPESILLEALARFGAAQEIERMKNALNNISGAVFQGGNATSVPVLLNDIRFFPSTLWAFAAGRPGAELSSSIFTEWVNSSLTVLAPVEGRIGTDADCMATIDQSSRVPEQGRNGFIISPGKLLISPSATTSATGTSLFFVGTLLDGAGQTLNGTPWTWTWSSDNPAVADIPSGSGPLGPSAPVRVVGSGSTIIRARATSPNGAISITREGSAVLAAEAIVLTIPPLLVARRSVSAVNGVDYAFVTCDVPISARGPVTADWVSLLGTLTHDNGRVVSSGFDLSFLNPPGPIRNGQTQMLANAGVGWPAADYPNGVGWSMQLTAIFTPQGSTTTVSQPLSFACR